MTNLKHESLYRYYSGTKRDIDSIIDGYLWFATLDKMNDAFEGVHAISEEGLDYLTIKSITRRSLIQHGRSAAAAERIVKREFRRSSDTPEKIQHMRSALIDSFKKSYQTVIERGYCCMIGNSEKQTADITESQLLLMWGHYGKGLSGFRVEFDHDALLSSLQENQALEPFQVSYSPKPPTVKLSKFLSELHFTGEPHSEEINKILSACFTTKHSAWSYEQEVRLCTKLPGMTTFDHNCIKEIIFGSRMDPSSMKEFISKVKEHMPHVKMKIARVSKNAYAIENIPI